MYFLARDDTDMIRSISLSSVASYGSHPVHLPDLKRANFIFGSNGVGKTTISRLLRDEATDGFSECTLSWQRDRIRVDVFNQDFIKAHFNTEGAIQGIYTLGEDNTKATREIEKLKREKAPIQQGLERAQQKLNGDPADLTLVGAKAMVKEIETNFREGLWAQKSALGDLYKALKIPNSKAQLYQRYVEMVPNNNSDLRSYDQLVEDYEIIFVSDLLEQSKIPELSSAQIFASEQNRVLKKIIVGSTDVDLASLISKLNNSDWVQTGCTHLKVSDGYCPFCQQVLPEDFSDRMADYFDETYEQDIKELRDARQNYENASDTLQRMVAQLVDPASKFLAADDVERLSHRLQQTCAGNLAALKRKQNNPSIQIDLQSCIELVDEINVLIENANAKIEQHNEIFHSQAQKKENLVLQIWRLFGESTKDLFASYKEGTENLAKKIAGLEDSITTKKARITELEANIRAEEAKISDINQAIHGINRLLSSFGYVGFSLVKATKKGFYEIVRPNGDDAKTTLSEGEKSFVTFLYFYHLIKGSFDESGASADRVVVFDDPVSSLDANVLGIVATLIRSVMSGMKKNGTHIRQIFILTHNAYFHQQLTFPLKRGAGDHTLSQAYFIVRKSGQFSDITSHQDVNPVLSTYDLLWAELRQDNPSCITVQNVMRRILEHYLQFYSGMNFDKLLGKFQDGNERAIFMSLISWLHDGSHSIADDINVVVSNEEVHQYMTVFHKVFCFLDQEEHYKQFMQEAYRELPALDPNDEGMVSEAAELVEGIS